MDARSVQLSTWHPRSRVDTPRYEDTSTIRRQKRYVDLCIVAWSVVTASTCGRHRENSAYAKGNSTARKVIGSMDARSVQLSTWHPRSREAGTWKRFLNFNNYFYECITKIFQFQQLIPSSSFPASFHYTLWFYGWLHLQCRYPLGGCARSSKFNDARINAITTHLQISTSIRWVTWNFERSIIRREG